MIFIAVTSYRGERFQVPTRLTTVTRQTGVTLGVLFESPVSFCFVFLEIVPILYIGSVGNDHSPTSGGE
jgi:hypothetical protein